MFTGIPRISSTLVFNLASKQIVDSRKMISPSENITPSLMVSIPNKVSFGDFNVAEFDMSEVVFHPIGADLTEFDLELLDDNYRPLDLNGASMWIELVVRFL